MITIERTFNGHDFTFGACVCGMTQKQYDETRQPQCAGLHMPEPVQPTAKASTDRPVTLP
jgi:hypothetical protein